MTCKIPRKRINTWAQTNRRILLRLNLNKLRRVGSASKIEISRTYTMEAIPYLFRTLIRLNKIMKIPPAKTRLATFKAMPVAFILFQICSVKIGKNMILS